jgi:hypothetical protein
LRIKPFEAELDSLEKKSAKIGQIACKRADGARQRLSK